MRGGNRQVPKVVNGKPPRPPRGLSEAEKEVWRELTAAVVEMGTFAPSDALYFRLTVRAVARAESPEPMPATARARVLQAAGAMLSAFGLSPLSRERVKTNPRDPMADVRRVLAEEGLE